MKTQKKRIIGIMLIITMLVNILPIQSTVLATIYEPTTQVIEFKGSEVYELGGAKGFHIDISLSGDDFSGFEFSLLMPQGVIRPSSSTSFAANAASNLTGGYTWGDDVVYSYYDDVEGDYLSGEFARAMNPSSSAVANAYTNEFNAGTYPSANGQKLVFGWASPLGGKYVDGFPQYMGTQLEAKSQERHIVRLYFRIMNETVFNSIEDKSTLFRFSDTGVGSTTGLKVLRTGSVEFVNTSMAQFTGILAPTAAKTETPHISSVTNNGTVDITVDQLGLAAVPAGTTFKLYQGNPASGGTELTGATYSVTGGTATISLTDIANSTIKKNINLGNIDNLYITANDGTNDDSIAVAVGDIPARVNTITNATNTFDYTVTNQYNLDYNTNTLPNPITLRGADTLPITYDPTTGAEPGGLTSINVASWSITSGNPTTVGPITFEGTINSLPPDVTGTGSEKIQIKANILAEVFHDADLANLSLNEASIGTFNSSQTSYSANVAGAVGTVTVNAGTKAGVGTQTVYYGTATNPTGTNNVITLGAAGTSTTVYVKVVADDGTTTKEYTITVTRAALNANALLSDIKVDGTSISGFTSTTKNYTVDVANSTSSVVITPTAVSGALTEIRVNGTVVASGANSTAITLDANPDLDTDITITTKAESGATDSYTVTIHRKSTNADLSDLKVGANTVTGFSSGTDTYNVILPYGTTVAPAISGTKADSAASVGTVVDTTVNGVGAKSITVTAEDGNTKTYTVNFTVDSTHPTLVITGPDKLNSKQNDVVIYTVEYTGALTGVGDIVLNGSNVHLNQTGVTGSAIQNINISGNTATIEVRIGSGNGTVGISIDAGTAKNINGSLAEAKGPSATTAVDNELPTITSPANGAMLNTDVTPVFNDSNYKNATLQKDGGTVDPYTQGTPIADEGVYVLTVYDEAGNSTTRTFTIDKTSPTITSPTEGAVLNANITPAFNDTNYDHATLQRNGGTVDSYAQGTPITTDGVYVLTVYDKAGNNTVRTFTIDKTAPTMTIVPNITMTKAGPVEFTVTYTGADTINLSEATKSTVSIVSANGITGDITVSNGLTADERIVTVSNITGNGKFKIEIASRKCK